jgi:hypothetical protein
MGVCAAGATRTLKGALYDRVNSLSLFEQPHFVDNLTPLRVHA